MFTLYGIPNCDTVKKARTWLDAHGLEYTFHDYKKQGIDATTLQRWSKALGYANLLNQRGTTWRKLAEAERDISSEAAAIALMQAQPSVIKRPMLDTGARLLQGFSENSYRSLL